MKITSIKIEKLFDLFDYDISFSNEENLLMITGPNGFGKTMILNIVYNLFNENFLFFFRFPFRKIFVELENAIVVEILNENNFNNNIALCRYNIYENEHLLIGFRKQIRLDNTSKRIQQVIPSITLNSEGKWIDDTNKVYSFERILDIYLNQFSEVDAKRFSEVHIPDSVSDSVSEKIINIFNSTKVHLVKEQRLYRTIQIDVNHSLHNEIVDTIQIYSKELSDIFSQFLQSSYIKSQELDSSYPNRLISEKGKLSEKEYNSRYKKLIKKLERLKSYGLYESRQETLTYSEPDAKALLVYLDDLEKKIGVFDTLLEKLELFTTILNERRFTFKSINIERDKGFYFKTSQGKDLELSQLSSGEQHEVVLLYELIFNAKEDTLILIDEPELSLHVSWQKEFINDLLKIGKLQNIQVIVATHSPAIINGRWDLVYNLEKVYAE